MNQKRRTILSVAAAMGTLALATGTLPGATILSTDFTGVNTSGSGPNPTATSITWDSVNGITEPTTSLTFSGADGFFSASNLISVDRNLSTEGPWSTMINLTLDASTASIDLTNLTIDWQAINNSGTPQTSNKNCSWTVEIIGSISGSLGTPNQVSGSAGSFVTTTVDLGSLSLNSTETYTLTLTATNSGSAGYNAAIDNLTLNGDITAIPEPATTALLGLGGLALIFRRRK